MACSIDADIGANEAIIAYSHHRLVKHCPIEISEKSSADLYVHSVVAVERLVYKGVVIAFGENFLQFIVALLDERRSKSVVVLAFVFTFIEEF